MGALVLGLILLSMLGVREQESSQLLAIGSSVHYAIVYIALFAIPLFGRIAAPPWLKPIAWAGLLSSAVSLFVAAYPIVDVVSKVVYTAKIAIALILANLTGILIYRLGSRHRSTVIQVE